MWDFSRVEWGPDARGEIDPLQKLVMLCDPQVYAALWLRRSMMLMDEPVFEPCLKRDEPRYDAAVKNAKLCEFAFRHVRGGLKPALAQIAQNDWWKNTVAEANWTEKTYDGKQVFVPHVLDVYSSGSYVLWREGGEIVGVQPMTAGTPLTKNGKQVVYDARTGKYLVNTFRPDPRGAWAGTDQARVVWQPFYSKNRGQPLELMYLELFSNPSIVGTAPEDANEMVPLLDQYGKPLKDENGEELKVPPQQAMSQGLENFGGSGSFTVIPPKSDLKLMEAQGDGRIFLNFEDGKDWQILTGILGTGNMTARAKYGSNASAQTGESAVSNPVAIDAAPIESEIQAMCGVIIERNNRRNQDLIPRVRLYDPRRSYYETLYNTLLNNSDYGDDRLVSSLAERIDGPKPNFDKLAQQREEMAQQQREAAQRQGAQGE